MLNKVIKYSSKSQATVVLLLISMLSMLKPVQSGSCPGDILDVPHGPNPYKTCSYTYYVCTSTVDHGAESLDPEAVWYKDDGYKVCDNKTGHGNSCRGRDELRRDDSESIFLVGTVEENVSAPLTEDEYCWIKDTWQGAEELEDGTHLYAKKPIDCSHIRARSGFTECLSLANSLGNCGSTIASQFTLGVLAAAMRSLCIAAYQRY